MKKRVSSKEVTQKPDVSSLAKKILSKYRKAFKTLASY